MRITFQLNNMTNIFKVSILQNSTIANRPEKSIPLKSPIKRLKRRLSRVSLITTLLTVCFILLTTGCVPPKVTSGEVPTSPSTKVTQKDGDTLAYTVEFFNKSEKDTFIKVFNTFMNEYPFSGISYDSTYNKITIKIFQGASVTSPESISTVQRFLFTDDAIQSPIWDTPTTSDSLSSVVSHDSISSVVLQDSTLVDSTLLDTTLIEFGGTLRIYSPRSSLDQTLLNFVLPNLQESIADSGIFSIIDSTPLKITLQLNDKVINARNRTISTLDLIQQWALFIKNNPAEGSALFYGVTGIMEYINGKEAIVRGFNAIDQKTIQIRFSSPQPLAPTRLITSRIIVQSLFLGPYYEEKSGNETVLLPNTFTRKRTAYLDNITLKTGGDPNPILSFSLNRYDALILNSLNDINYVRTTLSDKANLHKITGDRYFVACKLQDPAARSQLRNIINPETILKNYLKVEGEVISSTASNLPLVQSLPIRESIKAGSTGTIRILYRKDDFVSKNIAEKLLADCSNAGINSTLSVMDAAGYERALVSGDYDCAVGWVAETIIDNPNEKLRLAAMWFENDTDEEKRIQEFREIPLFAVNTYLCARKDIQLYNGELKGIYISNQTQQLQN